MRDVEQHDIRGPRALTRRGFLQAAVGTTGLLLLSACGGATQAPAPKPTEAPKPAAPAAKPTEAAKPAAEAKPAAQPTTQAAPAAKAPVSLKGTTLSWLQWTSFIPTADAFVKKQLEEGLAKETGATINFEAIDANQIQPRLSASVQAGTGPDIVHIRDNWAHTYKESLVDVSDVVEDLKKEWGELYPALDAVTKVDGKYLAVPHDFSGGVIHWRKSWFKEVGTEKFPETFDEYHAVGKKLKEKGRPFGQAYGHSFGDPPGWCYATMWAYGGREVDEQGKVAINSPETIAALKANAQAFKDAYDETGLAWDDGANNRAFLAETIAATQNGSSIWFVAKSGPTGKEASMPFFDDIALNPIPGGPKGRFLLPGLDNYVIPKYSKNVDAAKEFIKWQMTDPVWMPLFEVFGSFVTGVGPKQNDNPIWEKFPPVSRVFKQAPEGFRTLGWPGPANDKVGSVVSRYIVVDMFARAVQGESPEQAVAWAEREMKSVYG